MPLVWGCNIPYDLNAMEPPTHYELLCVKPEATANEIRAAYRRLIRVYHPDVTNEAGASMTRRLNEAQRELLDPSLRSEYDRSLLANAMPWGQRTYGHSHGTRTQERTHTSERPRTEWKPQQSWQPPAARTARSAPWSAARAGVWGTLAFGSIAAILACTVVVFAACYAGPLTLATPRVLPPLVIAIAWLVAGLPKTSKFLVALLTIGAGLWPLSAFGVAPFSWLGAALAPTVLPLLTLLAVAVLVFRLAAPRFNDLLRARPVHRPTAA
jgi:hypothetical protein